MGSLVLVNTTSQQWALLYLRHEAAELKLKLAAVEQALAADRNAFQQANDALARLQAPLLNEIAGRNAEISRLGGRVPVQRFGVMQPMLEQGSEAEERMK